MLKYVKDALDFSAFRPEPDDPAAPWGQRLGHEKTALVHMGRNALSYAIIDRHGKISPGESRRGDPKEMMAELGPLIADKTDNGWCMLSLNTRYVISIEHNLPRKQGSEDTIKTDPRSVLHARYERGKRYAVTHNPETNSSLLLTYEEDNIKKAELIFKEHGLKLGRVCCGAYALLRHALTATNVSRGNEKPFSAFYLVCCAGSICALVQEKDTWLELRSRPDVYDDDIQPLLDIIEPFAERLSPGNGIVLACDEPIDGLHAKLAQIFPGRPVNDLTNGNLLAEILLKN